MLLDLLTYELHFFRLGMENLILFAWKLVSNAEAAWWIRSSKEIKYQLCNMICLQVCIINSMVVTVHGMHLHDAENKQRERSMLCNACLVLLTACCGIKESAVGTLYDSVVSATKQAATFWVSLASIVQFSITNGSSRCSVMWHCNTWLSSCKLLQPYRYTRPNLKQDKGFFGATILLLRSVGYRTPLWSLEKDSEVSFAMYQ
jgi:hypothetical protein